MNWDTHEISMLIESNETYYNYLKKQVGNELYFMAVLWVIIEDYNKKMNGNGREIDSSQVNGNEVYIDFCEAVGNETEGWK